MNRIEPAMVTIPAGTCTLGVPAAPADAGIQHPWSGPRRVQVPAFAIGQTPVTVAEYRAYLAAAQRPVTDHLQRPNFGRPDLPVTDISWEDATAYARWLAGVTGRAYRLPTDAEWECAARGGREGCLYPWGDDVPAGRACLGRAEQDGPLPVRAFPANGFGLLDMAGNVWQWCGDLYTEVAADGPVNKPTGKDPAVNRVLRGGSYMTPDPMYLRCAYRHEDPPDLRHACLGFRVAADA
ncbi:SUMF1/EgtB/PvdO family nonheme iron enzyme [bacterium]|nr:SUMF1/EgtB/PvdO family nonheme iron enzyme [bacterium]